MRGGLAVVEGGQTVPELVQLVGDALVLRGYACDVLLMLVLKLEDGRHELLGGPTDQLIFGDQSRHRGSGRMGRTRGEDMLMRVLRRRGRRVMLLLMKGRRRWRRGSGSGSLHYGGAGQTSTSRGTNGTFSRMSLRGRGCGAGSSMQLGCGRALCPRRRAWGG
jgi:hypothetical protein